MQAHARRGRSMFEPWMAVASIVAVLVLFFGVRAVFGSRGGSGQSGGSGTKAANGMAERSVSATTSVGTSTSAVFARLKKYGVPMHFPASADEMLAVGFHQSWNLNGTDMVPQLPVHAKDKYEATKKALASDPNLKLFEMMSRGRGSSEYSAADCAVKPGATILSPVTGTVTLVKKYRLEGKYDDYRVEIKADGAAPVRVVLIHIQDIRVKEGQRVSGGVSPIATVRHLLIDSQVNRYLPWPADHSHVQINAAGYTLNSGS
jgi:hypothetical protein